MNLYGQKEITVYDITGRTCMSGKALPNSISYSLDTRNFANGIYMVRVKDEGGEVTRKLIISGIK